MSKSNISVGTKGWADSINAIWRRSINEVISVGARLVEAKSAIPHGDFEDMIKTKLDFSPQTARKLMAIAKDQRVLNRAQGAIPDHWSTLYELTKLSDDQFEQALKDGTIHADMERKDVPKKRKETPQGAAVLKDGGGESVPPLTGADLGTPQDDREGEDSGVNIIEGDPWLSQDPERAEIVDQESKPSQAAAGAVAVYINPNDPMSRFANGLILALAGSAELDPRTAAADFPEDMPLLRDEISEFLSWLDVFEAEFHKRYGAGNDAGIGL